MVSKNSKKRSAAWDYFVICEDDSRFAKCLICAAKISRGGEGQRAGTSGMNNHIKKKHRDKLLYEEKSGKLVSSFPIPSTSFSMPSIKQEPKQSDINESLPAKSMWDINDPAAQKYHYLLAEMIVLDNEPISMIERTGFKRLMQKILPDYKIPGRTYLADKIIPDIYERINTKIKNSISKISEISITLHTSTKNNKSFVSFTAHWLSTEFQSNHAVLAMKPFSGENIAELIQSVATSWGLPNTKIHLVVYDSDPNKIQNINLAEHSSVRCFIQTLQLIIDDALKSQLAIFETLTAARQIVTHFSQSETAQQELKNIQNKFNLPQNQLIQDVSTRWTSMFYMLERLMEQKEAILYYISDKNPSNEIKNVTEHEWGLIGEIIRLLKPFDEITKFTSSANSCISEVIPHVATLLRYLEKEETTNKTTNLVAMKCSLKYGLKKHFDGLDNKIYLLATLLDPRFKTNFMEINQHQKAREAIVLEAFKLCCNPSISNSDNVVPYKKIKKINTSDVHNNFWSCFEEVAEENENSQGQNILNQNTISSELEYYLKLPRVDRNSNPYEWWSANANHYPMLAQIAKIYLSAPSNSTALFSDVALVYDNKRSSYLPVNAEKMVLIQHNLPLVNFEY